MAQSILIFDFGNNEQAAQQARHRVEGWKQAFHLGDKIQLKFERVESGEESDSSGAEDEAGAEKPPGAKKSRAKKSASAKKTETEKEEESEAPATHIRILIRLDFSDHEKLSHQRWLDRIPAEEPFKSAEAETVRQADESFDKITELFDSLD